MKQITAQRSRQSGLDQRLNAARLAGANKRMTQAEFRNYILEIGLAKYEKFILPIETGESKKEYPALAGSKAKIIPFPGVTLEAPEDRFQNGLDGFLREMGYVE
jgi:hypothetical protein